MTNNDYPQRKSPRLANTDYTQQGGYFVTICTHGHKHLFGHIDKSGVMHCNEYGEIVWDCWLDLPNHYQNIELGEFVVMPNHVHGIIFMIDDSELEAEKREGFKPSPTEKRHGLTEIVRALKSFSARRINQKRKVKGIPVWQRTFHDHFIRNEAQLNKLREYVLNNPEVWATDLYFSDEA
jgi:putative transposase